VLILWLPTPIQFYSNRRNPAPSQHTHAQLP
jgi:hypothetical protein